MTIDLENNAPPRLNRMVVSNYRSVGENVAIDFEPLTVLVGINGSGKSNLLDAPRFVAEALSDGLENAIEARHGFDSLRRDVGGKRGSLSISLELSSTDWSATYRIELTAPKTKPDEYSISSERLDVRYVATGEHHTMEIGQRGKLSTTLTGLDRPTRDRRNLTLFVIGGDERLAPVVDALRAVETYALFPETLREPQKPSQRDYLTKFGDNWPNVVRKVMADAIASRDIGSALYRVTGDIVDIRASRLGAGYLVVEFAHRGVDGAIRWFDATRESDGTLRVAGLLTALVQQPPLTMIGIEEPELTIHAGVIPLLADFLETASLNSRVVVTTHSPELLDLDVVPPNAIRVVDRINGTTRVGRLSDGQQQLVRDRLASSGELLRSQGLIGEDS